MSLCHVTVFISHIDWSTGSVVWLNSTVNLSNRFIIMSTHQVYVIIGHIDWYTLGVVGFKTMLVCPICIILFKNHVILFIEHKDRSSLRAAWFLKNVGCPTAVLRYQLNMLRGRPFVLLG